METLSLNKLNDVLTNEKKETNFWDIINDMNWYNVISSDTTLPNEHIKDYLIGFMDVNFVSEFKNFVVDRRKEIQENYLNLRNNTDYQPSTFIGNDNLWDVTASIVGMGKSTYEMALKTPQFVEFIYQTKNYKENFEYGFDAAIYEINDLVYEWNKKQRNEG